MTNQLTSKKIFLYWLPLAASWLLMASERPFINSMLARLDEAEKNIAAFGIVAIISITIESPVISLLSTSTALARTRQSYLQLRRFTIHLMILTTILHVLMGWTKLFDLVVIDWMGVPDSLHAAIRSGMQYMLLWSAAIAWRRYTQGILIRYDKTRYVGAGTVIRLISSAGTAAGLTFFSDASSIAIGTLALEAGVIIEGIYAHWVARDLITERFGPDVSQPNEPDLSYSALVKFHSPLAASTLLLLLTNPMISAALARSPQPITDLAAWPILSDLLFLSRAAAFALPEVVIALYDQQEDKSVLSKFGLQAGLGLTALLGLVIFTPLSRFFFQTVIGVNAELATIAVNGARVGLFLPIITTSLSHARGALTARKTTLPITLGMVAELLTMAIILVIGVITQATGTLVAAGALSAAMLVDVIVLDLAAKRSDQKIFQGS